MANRKRHGSRPFDPQISADFDTAYNNHGLVREISSIDSQFQCVEHRYSQCLNSGRKKAASYDTQNRLSKERYSARLAVSAEKEPKPLVLQSMVLTAELSEHPAYTLKSPRFQITKKPLFVLILWYTFQYYLHTIETVFCRRIVSIHATEGTLAWPSPMTANLEPLIRIAWKLYNNDYADR